MALTSLRVLYTGPGLSGRTTSLNSIMELTPGWKRIARRGLDIWSGDVGFGGANVAIEASVSVARSHHMVNLREGAQASTAEAEEVEFLKAMDAVVFVVDSQALRLDDNVYILEELAEAVALIGRRPESIPLVFQLNKRDLTSADSVENLSCVMRWPQARHTESVATRNLGTVEAICSLIEIAARH